MRAFRRGNPDRAARARLVLRDKTDLVRHARNRICRRASLVLDALCLMFNEGYAATSGDQLIRGDVAAEAIRLTRMIAMHPAIAAPLHGRCWR